MLSTRPWQPGQHAEVIPENNEPPMRGEVIYCHRLDNGRFCIGVRFPHSRIRWSNLQRYDGFMNQQGQGRAEGIERSWSSRELSCASGRLERGSLTLQRGLGSAVHPMRRKTLILKLIAGNEVLT